MSNAINVWSPVGRIVGGSVFEERTTDMDGNPLVVKSGPNAGQARKEYWFNVAVLKTDSGVNAFYNQIVTVARQSFPNLFNADGTCLRPRFAFKIIDGDSQAFDEGKNPKRNCDREGYAGCWVFKFKNGFPPKVFTKGGAQTITDPKAVKCGDYIRVYAQISGNDNDTKPGVYLNCPIIEQIGYGPEISFGPNAEEIFKAAPQASIPSGVSTVPMAPATTLAAPGAVMPPMGGPALPPPLPVNVTPAPDFLTPPPAATMAPPPPAPPAAPVEDYFIAPNGARVARSALIGAGWNDAQISTLKRG